MSAKNVPTVPTSITAVTSRTVAEVLGCSMGHVRNLARKSRLKSWKLGARSVLFDLKEVEEYRKAMAQWRKEGHRGATPGGFQADE